MQLRVEEPSQGEFHWSAVVDESRDGVDLRAAITDVIEQRPDGNLQLWIRSVDSAADSIAEALGFEPYRDLWQLRCALPNAASELDTRAFTEADLDEFVSVNNRAFAWHPEQGGLTVDAMQTTMLEPWFNPDGFRLFHENDRLAGYCWTKVHPDTEPPLGEIYVIAIDPDFHGRGLGRPMTLAGLEWLTAQGLDHAILYVESDNGAANATYAALGFVRHHTDRAYRLDR